MTNEEAIGRIRDHMERHGIGQYPHSKLAEALEMAISALQSVGKDITVPTKDDHFREVTKMVPLTLEQLRSMVNEPAYLYIYDTALNSGWHIIKAVTEDKIIFRGWNTVYVPISSLGKCFDLYAYPPAHIDREEWEPCELCEKQRKVFNEDFCGNCGRPLKEEAWIILEQRLTQFMAAFASQQKEDGHGTK